MNAKKSKKADLEKRKGTFLEIGLVVTLSIILVAFEWTKGERKDDGSDAVAEIQFEDEMMQITRREEPKPEPPKRQRRTRPRPQPQPEEPAEEPDGDEGEQKAEAGLQREGGSAVSRLRGLRHHCRELRRVGHDEEPPCPGDAGEQPRVGPEKPPDEQRTYAAGRHGEVDEALPSDPVGLPPQPSSVDW